MKIHFRDVQTGMVEARAIIEIEDGVFLNEVTLLNIDNQLVVEFPRKNFVGKNDRTHHLDIITFESEDKQVLWELQIKQAYREWRKDNRKVLIYEDKRPGEPEKEERPRRQFRERSYGDRKPRDYSDRDDRPRRFDRPQGDRPYKENRSYGDRPPRDSSYAPRTPRGDRGDKSPRRVPADQREGKPSFRDRQPKEGRSYGEKPYREKRYNDDSSTPKRRTFDDKSSEKKPFRQASTTTGKRQYTKRSDSPKPRSRSTDTPKTRKPKN